MKVKIFFIVITMFFFPFFAKAQQTPKEWLETKGKYLIQTFSIEDENTKHQKLDTLLQQDIDLNYIAKFVIGKYYRIMSAEQKQRYFSSFKNYALYTYKQFPLNFGQEISFNITNITKGKYFINANVDITLNPEAIFNVEFILRETQNTYKIVDIKIANASLILAYRNRFYEMISQADEEIDWFLDDLEALGK